MPLQNPLRSCSSPGQAYHQDFTDRQHALEDLARKVTIIDSGWLQDSNLLTACSYYEVDLWNVVTELFDTMMAEWLLNKVWFGASSQSLWILTAGLF